MPGSDNSFELKEPDRRQLREWVGAYGTPQQVALRCRIVLAAAKGHSDYQIAAKLESNRKTVMLWRRRFVQEGVDALWEVAAGRGRKPTYGPGKIQAIVDTTLRAKPKGATHWSCRTLAAAQGISKSAVNRIWQSHNLKPHRTKTFKLSRDREVSGETDRRGGPLSEPSATGAGAVRR